MTHKPHPIAQGVAATAATLCLFLGAVYPAAAQHASPAPAIGPIIGAVNADDAPIRGSFEGVFVEGFETSRFTPCFGASSWWLSTASAADGPFWLAIENLRTGAHQELGADKPVGSPVYYLRVDGAASKTGRYGHLGAYTREVLVTSVATVRIATPADLARCKSAHAHMSGTPSPKDAAKN